MLVERVDENKFWIKRRNLIGQSNSERVTLTESDQAPFIIASSDSS